MSTSPHSSTRGDRGRERTVTHGHGVLLSADFDRLHLLLYLLQLHLLLPVLGHVLHLCHPHGCLLLLVVVVSVDGVPLGRVGAVLRLGAVERHYRVFDVLFGLFGDQARVQEQRRLVLGRAKVWLTTHTRLSLSDRVGKG